MMQRLLAAIHQVERLFEDTGRVLIRPSGTEAMIRIMIEGQDLPLMEEQANRLAEIMKRDLCPDNNLFKNSRRTLLKRFGGYFDCSRYCLGDIP